jgi:glycosyltransferase involved in cell wall biosynthesis
MKVVHLCSSDILGGAAKAAYYIHKALNFSGVNSFMLVQKKYSDDKTVFPFVDSMIKEIKYTERFLMDYLFINYLTVKERGRFSFPYWGVNVSKHLLLKKADLIHLHWINQGYFSFKTLRLLALLNKPVFWTFHDMWAFTGGCHYTNNCERFINNCGNCPSLKNSSPEDYSHKIWSQKKQIFSELDLNLVTPSNWLRDYAKKSSLFEDKKIEVIPYAIDLELFKPKNKLEIRNNLGFPKDKILILFGSMNVKDERKGFKYFKESLIKLLEINPGFKDRIKIIVFGKSDQEMQADIPFEFIFYGRIDSDEKIVALYNAADFFVISSLEDNYPNTVMEALSCGLPVLAFDTGGIPDMVSHLRNGYLASFRNSDSLAQGMEWLINNKNIGEQISRNARAGITENNSFKSIGEKYSHLYNKSLAK